MEYLFVTFAVAATLVGVYSWLVLFYKVWRWFVGRMYWRFDIDLGY